MDALKRCILAGGLLLCLGFPTLACTCAEHLETQVFQPTEQFKKMTPEQRREFAKNRDAEAVARRKGRATVIVRGRVSSVRAGEDVFMPSGPAALSGANSTTLTSPRAVVADFKVRQVVKGKAADQVKLYTGFGTGDCGVATALLVAVAWDREISIAAEPISGTPDAYAVNMCGYAEMHDPKPQ